MQPVGQEFPGAGPGAKEIELGLLNSVFSLPALAIQADVECVGRPIEVADDKAGVGARTAALQPADNPAFPLLSGGGIAEFPNLILLDARFQILRGHLHSLPSIIRCGRASLAMPMM